MEKGQISRTAQVTAGMRALHLVIDDDPPIFVDPLASSLIDSQGARMLRELLPVMFEERMVHLRSMCVMRHRWVEDQLVRAYQQGVTQLVILGAGLDSFAYRCPENMRGLRIFEADYPSTQKWKQNRLAEIGLAPPVNLTFVPIDFQSDSLEFALRENGLDFGSPAFISWLGVNIYLTREATFGTLGTVASKAAAGSAILFDVCLDHSVLDEAGRGQLNVLMKRVAARGEPITCLFNPDDLIHELNNMGFGSVDYVSPEMVNEKYFNDRTDGLNNSAYYGLVKAAVG